MRSVLLGGLLLTATLFPQIGNAQVYRFETPPPAVTAADAPWQLSGESIVHAGQFYYPTGPTVFFDGRVMERVDSWRGVPLYEDSTLEPYSVVYLPVGGNLMRPYERRRDGELAGTVGSRQPSFPVSIDAEHPDLVGTMGRATYDAGNARTRGVNNISGATDAPVEFTAHGVITIQPEQRQSTSAAQQDGVWIEFGGARWYSAGPAVVPDSTRFESAGDYRGFPVYRQRDGATGRIYVSVVPGGPLAPFERR